MYSSLNSLFWMSKNGKDDYENQRKAILAKTHNVTDNYCQACSGLFQNYGITEKIRKPFLHASGFIPQKEGSPCRGGI